MIKILKKDELYPFKKKTKYHKTNDEIEEFVNIFYLNDEIYKHFDYLDILYSKYYWLCKYNEKFRIIYEYYDYEIQEQISHTIEEIDQCKETINVDLLESLEKKAINEISENDI